MSRTPNTSCAASTRIAPSGLAALLNTFGVSRAADEISAIESFLKSREVLEKLNARIDLRAVYGSPGGRLAVALPAVLGARLLREPLRLHALLLRASTRTPPAASPRSTSPRSTRPPPRRSPRPCWRWPATWPTASTRARKPTWSIPPSTSSTRRATTSSRRRPSSPRSATSRCSSIRSPSPARCCRTSARCRSNAPAPRRRSPNRAAFAQQPRRSNSLKASASALDHKVDEERGKLAGDNSALAGKVANYERLTPAARSRAEALRRRAGVVAERRDRGAAQAHLYRGDRPAEPARRADPARAAAQRRLRRSSSASSPSRSCGFSASARRTTRNEAAASGAPPMIADPPRVNEIELQPVHSKGELVVDNWWQPDRGAAAASRCTAAIGLEIFTLVLPLAFGLVYQLVDRRAALCLGIRVHGAHARQQRHGQSGDAADRPEGHARQRRDLRGHRISDLARRRRHAGRARRAEGDPGAPAGRFHQPLPQPVHARHARAAVPPLPEFRRSRRSVPTAASRGCAPSPSRRRTR